MRTKYRGLGVIALLIVSAVVFIAVAFVGLSQLSSNSRQLVNLKVQSRTADNQLSSLAAVKKQVQKYAYFNQVAKTVIPNDKDQAQAVLDIFQMAANSGIALQNIDFPASSLGIKPTVPASGSQPSGNTNVLSQAKPVEGIPGLYSLQLVITPQTGNGVPSNQISTYPKFLDFLNRIEHDRRTAQITEVSIQPQSASSTLGFTLTLNIFIKP